jgi:hypothetical protein
MGIWKPYGARMANVCRQKVSTPTAWRGRGCWVLVMTTLSATMIFGTGAALAQSPKPGTFSPPDGCTGWLTVQSRGCRVSNHYRCEADPAGHQWRADFDQEGIFFVSRIDSEAQWIESYDLFPTVRQTLDAGANDPASFSELLASGTDTYDFYLTEDGGRQTHVSGFDMLTGQSTSIDGIALQETRFEFSEHESDGTLVRKAAGNEYINPEWRMFFSGPSEWETDEGPVAIDGSPKLFIFPGEKGFFSSEPIFDCDVTTSQAEDATGIVPVAARR